VLQQALAHRLVILLEDWRAQSLWNSANQRSECVLICSPATHGIMQAANPQLYLRLEECFHATLPVVGEEPAVRTGLGFNLLTQVTCRKCACVLLAHVLHAHAIGRPKNLYQALLLIKRIIAPLSDVPQVLCMIELLLRHAAPISPGGERLEGDKASVGRIGFQHYLVHFFLARLRPPDQGQHHIHLVLADAAGAVQVEGLELESPGHLRGGGVQHRLLQDCQRLRLPPLPPLGVEVAVLEVPVLHIVMQPGLDVHGVAVLQLHGPPLLEEPEDLAGSRLVLVRQGQRCGVGGCLQILACVHVLKAEVIAILQNGSAAILAAGLKDAGALQLLALGDESISSFKGHLRVGENQVDQVPPVDLRWHCGGVVPHKGKEVVRLVPHFVPFISHMSIHREGSARADVHVLRLWSRWWSIRFRLCGVLFLLRCATAHRNYRMPNRQKGRKG